jgi:hypothetical protein
MTHIMLDLETLGTGPRAAIVAIGACEFALRGGGMEGRGIDPFDVNIGSTFYARVSLASAMAHGDVDPSTLLWWMQQSDAARKATFQGEADSLEPALRSFTYYLQHVDNSELLDGLCVWGNGAAFDNVVIRSAYARIGGRAPWSFRNDKCYRTVIGLVPDQGFERHGDAHNALDDAITQALYLQKVYKALGL